MIMYAICLPRKTRSCFLSTLLFDTYSLSDMHLRVEKLFQCRRNHRIKHIEYIGEMCRSTIDRDVISSPIDLAISTSLIQCIVI